MENHLIEVRSPHDGSVIDSIVCDNWTSIDAKVVAAKMAMRDWSQKNSNDHAEALTKIAEATRAEISVLVPLLTREHGKTYREAEMELERYIGQFIQYAAMTSSIDGRDVSLGDGLTGWRSGSDHSMELSCISFWHEIGSSVNSRMWIYRQASRINHAYHATARENCARVSS